MATLQNIKDSVTLAIDAMESLYDYRSILKSDWQISRSWITANNSKLGAALMVVGHFRNQPVIQDQARIIWRQTLYQRLPTVWFVRSHSAGKVVFFAICSLAGVSIDKMVNGELTEQDFGRLTYVVGYLAHAPLRTCEIGEPNQFKESIEALAAEKTFCYAICDWELLGEDLALAEHFARTSNITFLCPS